VRTDEFHPLGPDQLVRWDDGTTSSTWSEDTAAGAGNQIIATYADGPTEGALALTRRRVGRGAAWYLSTQPDAQGLARVLARILAGAGAAPALALPVDHPAVIAGTWTRCIAELRTGPG
jgi:beta-galactosidase